MSTIASRSPRRTLCDIRSSGSRWALCIALGAGMPHVLLAQASGDRMRPPTGDSLTAQVQTVTGPAPRVELAGSRSPFAVAEHITTLPVETLSQLLSGRFAGVQVLSTGATGTGSRIRIRGQSSLLLPNDPLVIVDGVRLYPSLNDATTAVPSRLDDINPEEIDDIEVLSGLSATTLYGSGAANGVISITTKRGQAGRLRINAYTENGLITDPNGYPDLWALWGKRNGSATSSICTLSLVSTRACTVDSLSHGNPMSIDSLTPISRGSRSQYGASASAGNRYVQFFVAGEAEHETGVYEMPAREVQRLETERGVTSLPHDQVRPSALGRNSVRANIDAQPASWLTLHLSSAYVNGDTRLVPNEGQSTGLAVSTTGGVWRQDLRDATGAPLAGYAGIGVGDIMAQSHSQHIDRSISNAGAELHPLGWLTVRANASLDDGRQRDRTLIRRNEGPKTDTRRGFVSDERTHFSEQTFDVGATVTARPLGWLGTKTSIGAQRIRTRTDSDLETGSGLPEGATTVAAAEARGGSTSLEERRMLGLYAEEVLSVNDRLFITGGVRRDTPNAFGLDLPAVTYPTVGVSWLVAGEDGNSTRRRLNTVRLRAAYGTSGQFADALQYLAFAPLSSGGTANVTDGALKPEYSAEFEAGIDVSLFGSTSNLAFTWYNKQTTDALITRFLPPSIGGATTSLDNGATIRNRGLEVLFNQQLVNRKQFAATVTVTGSANANRMTALPADVSPIFTGDRNTEKNRQDYPLFGLWSRTYTYADANGDGILTLNELQFSDTARFLGSSFPTREAAITPTVELLNHRLRFAAQIDSKWGFRKFNNTLRHQCQAPSSCRGLNDRSAPLQTQADALAVNAGTFAGMFEDGAFTRFREASVAYALPSRWAGAFRASAWNVVLTGRNLGVITNYSGADPESSTSTTDARQDEYFSTPPMRYFTLRFNFTF